MKDQLAILNMLDPGREYRVIPADGGGEELYRLTDATRDYSPNLCQRDMEAYITGFATGIEVQTDRVAESEKSE